MNELTGDKIYDSSGRDAYGSLINCSWIADTIDIGNYIELSSNVGKYASMSQGSIVLSMSIETDPGATWAKFFTFSCSADASSDASIMWERDWDAVSWRLRNDGGETIRAVADDVPNLVGTGIFQFVVAVGPSGNSIYMNGQKSTPTYSSGDATNNDFFEDVTGLDFLALGIGKDSGGFEYRLDGRFQYFYLYNRRLSDDEVAWLHREPYAMFEQPSRAKYFYVEESSSSSSESSSSSSESVSTSSSSSSESVSQSSSSSSWSCSSDATKIYTRGDYAALPGDDTDLETPFTCQEYPDVATDDNTYIQQAATDEYSIFEWKNKNDDSTDGIVINWKGKSNRAPSASTVYLQVYNRITPGWENVDSNNVANADEEFELSGNISTNLDEYYDAQHWVSCRVYQRAI